MSFTSRLEGLFERVGLGGVVGEVRTLLHRAREAVKPEPPSSVPVPEKTVLERTPRPAPIPAEKTVLERTPRPAPVAEAPAAEPASTPRAKKPRPPKAAKAPSPSADAAAPKARKSASRKPRAKAKKPRRGGGAAPTPQEASAAVAKLMEALRTHPRQEELVSVGRQKDQLARSLIPLYLVHAAEVDLEVTSGTMSRFWGELGVTYAAPNAAKALRLHAGYAEDTRKGKAITPRGVQYVEQALEKLRS